MPDPLTPADLAAMRALAEEDRTIAMPPSTMLALLAERDALAARVQRMEEALVQMVTTFYVAGCHVCGGDCAAANPPIGGCPVHVIERVRAALAEPGA